ncbi:MAG: TlpA disulfide reductase family protein, partial [Aggregatilineales bacterium]
MTEIEHISEKNSVDVNNPGNASPALIVFLVMPLLLLFAALAMVAIDTVNQQNNIANAYDSIGYDSNVNLVNFQAPIVELPDLEGNVVSLDDFLGRPVFLNFWFTACPPCVREMPALGAFAEEQGEDGAVVLAVDFDDTSQMVRDFLEEEGIDNPPLILMDVEGRFSRIYGVVQAPVTYVIDSTGVVRRKHIGEL